MLISRESVILAGFCIKIVKDQITSSLRVLNSFLNTVGGGEEGGHCPLDMQNSNLNITC